MIKQTLVWTVLPKRMNGTVTAGNDIELAIMVAPRLWNDDPTVKAMPLGAFADWVEWTETVKNASLALQFSNGDSYTVTPTVSRLDSNQWRALFKPDTQVYPFVFADASGATILSPDLIGLHETIKGVYQDIGTDPRYGAGAELPAIEVLATHPVFTDIAEPSHPEPPIVTPPNTDPPVYYDAPEPAPLPDPLPPSTEPTLPAAGCGCGCLTVPFRLLVWAIQRLFGLFGSAGAPPALSNKANFDTLRAFLDTNTPTDDPLPGDEMLDEFDFHKMMALLGDYPILQRTLGLVLEVSVPLTNPLPPTGTVKVVPTLLMQDPATHFSPRTHYEIDTDYFYTRPRPGGELTRGLLRLNSAAYDVQQVEVPGSAVKLQNAATQMVYLNHQGASPITPKKQGLPALETTGLVLVRRALATLLHAQFRQSYALNKALSAIDTSPNAAYKGSDGEPAASDELFAEDVVRGYRFDVWDDHANRWHSLCLRRGTYTFLEHPGAPVTLNDLPDEGMVQMAVAARRSDDPLEKMHLAELVGTWRGWSLVASRPMLTVMVDDSHDNPANDPLTAFKLQTAFRAEPKSLPRLRYTYTYRLRVRMADLAGNSVYDPDSNLTTPFQSDLSSTTREITFQRFEPLAPPSLMLRTLPQEGESLERMTVRSRVDDPAAVIQAQTNERHLLPPATSQHIAEHHRLFDGAARMRSDVAAYDLASREASTITHRLEWVNSTDKGTLVPLVGVTEEPLPQTPQDKVWVNVNAQAEVAYLPDPLARGVLLLGLPGLLAEEIIEPSGVIVNKIPFDGVYPDHRALRLQVQGIEAGVAPATPVWDGVNRVLTVQLPQGESYVVRVSSYLQLSDLQEFGLWGWFEERVASDPILQKSLQDAIVAGRHWLLMPFRTITLVHAVQQPLQIAAITAMNAPAGESTKKIGETVALLRPTLSLDGKSTGKVDLNAAWQDVYDDVSKPTFDPLVDIRATAMYVAEEQLPDPTDNSPAFDVAHTIGDTRYHEVVYQVVASSRFREYFPAAITADPANLVRPMAGEVAPTFTFDIPNSARPAAPKVLYVLPTFRWREQQVGDLITHERQGSGVRVYLERPWFSSGNGELLGVTLRPPTVIPNDTNTKLLRTLTSEWGQDPLWAGVPTNALRQADFDTTSATVQTALSVGETDSFAVDVVGYAPDFDDSRSLWACDIPFVPNNHYMPFARLAVARFQPKSIVGAHLSPVTLTDYVQLAPQRTVEYDLSGQAAGAIAVRAYGPSGLHTRLRHERDTTNWRVELQRRAFPDMPDDEALGWQTVSVTELEPKLLAQGLWEWTGRIDLTVAAGATPLRLLVLESEPYHRDAQEIEDDLLEGIYAPRLDIPNRVGEAAERKRYRVVFADAIVL